MIESASRLDEVNPGIPASVPQEKMLFLAILYWRSYFGQDGWPWPLSQKNLANIQLASCINSRFSSLLAVEDVSRGGTSAPQRQKCHSDDVNQCLHNKSGSHRLEMQICSILRFSWSILVKCYVHLRTSCSKSQMLLSREEYTPQILAVIDSSRLYLTFAAFCLLSVIRKQQFKQCNYSVDQSTLMTGFRTNCTLSVWNFCR